MPKLSVSAATSIGCAGFVALIWLAYAVESHVPVRVCTHSRMTLEGYLLYARMLALALPFLGLFLAAAARRTKRIAAFAAALNIAALLWNVLWLTHWVAVGRFACLRS